MKRKLTPLICLGLLALGGNVYGQYTTGPSSTKSPYLTAEQAGAKVTSIITAGDTAANGYKMAGTPDGMGAYDNGDGTFTLLVNHEFGPTAGVVRAHGNAGAFVSKWVINKSNLSVVSGQDLMTTVKLWNPGSQSFSTYNATNPMPTGFGRFCSADLAPVSAYYNAATGKGTNARIFMNGEETGAEGRGMAHVATGPSAGTSYELARLGKFSWENSVAHPNSGDKTIVVGLDDATPGQVYIYIGTKTNTGLEIDKAGLTNGMLYGVSVSGMMLEGNTNFAAANTPFSMVNLGDVSAMSGATLQTNSNNMGVTQFLRPEDGAWDPRHPEDFYFATTNALTSPTRIWKLHFNNANDLTQGGVITAVLDGTEGPKMMDNIGFDHHGNLIIVEDVGGNVHLGKTWSYNVDRDALTLVLSHDTTRFLNGGSNFLTQDEELSGVVDASNFLGEGWFFAGDQTHYAIAGELVEGGQILAFYNPNTAASATTGLASSQPAYTVPVYAGARIKSLITAGDTAKNGYKMVGVPDGAGAYDNGDGTFTLLLNHELGQTAGIVRAHGNTGAFVSKWIVNKSDLSMISGADLSNTIKLWNVASQSYTTHNTANPMPIGFGRFCSADLPATSAFYNSATSRGTMERIFMNGEETGAEGKGMAHIVTGPEAGISYELPHLGKFSWENSVASPYMSDKTVVAGLDDATPGQVYIYIGTKQTSGNTIEKAGLTNGNLYGVAVSGMMLEGNSSFAAPNTAFTMVNLGNVSNMTGAALQTNSNNNGVTQFLRPEDGAWDPRHPEDFYFATTNAINSPTRIWKLHFSNVNDLTQGGTITAVLDGTEGQKMMDNIGFDKHGNMVIVEDVGGDARLGRTWNYNVDTDVFTELLTHDSTRFLNGGSKFITQDEELSGVFDISDILGDGWFFGADQIHKTVPGELVEGGQMIVFYNPLSKCAARETVTANGPTTICAGSSVLLKAASSTDGSYLWSTGATTQTISVNTAGNYSVQVADASCSVASDTVAVTVKNVPNVTITNLPGNPTNICEGATTIFTANPNTNFDGYSFQWNKNATPIPGATSSTYGITQEGAYTLTVTGGGPGCFKTSAAKAVTVKPNPVAEFTASGSTEFCQGASVTFSATAIPFYTYAWLKDGVNKGAGASKTFKEAGNYVLVAKLNGCADTSDMQTIVVNPLPVASVSSMTPATICAGDTAVLDATPAGMGFMYSWIKGTATIAGATSESYFATTASTYKVVVTDDNGCTSKASAGYKVTVNPTPFAFITPAGNPAIPSNGNVKLKATTGSGFVYQWYLNGAPITGATLKDYTATAGGDYTVEIAKGTCSSISAPLTVTQSSVKEIAGTTSTEMELDASFEFVAYPNPVSDVLTISVRGIEQVDATVHVVDMNGRLVTALHMNEQNASVDMSRYAPGFYLIRYKDVDGRTGTIKVSKQ